MFRFSLKIIHNINNTWFEHSSKCKFVKHFEIYNLWNDTRQVEFNLYQVYKLWFHFALMTLLLKHFPNKWNYFLFYVALHCVMKGVLLTTLKRVNWCKHFIKLNSRNYSANYFHGMWWMVLRTILKFFNSNAEYLLFFK